MLIIFYKKYNCDYSCRETFQQNFVLDFECLDDISFCIEQYFVS